MTDTLTIDAAPFFRAADHEPMSHLVNEAETHTLCGIPLEPHDVVSVDPAPIDCVVCEDLWTTG